MEMETKKIHGWTKCPTCEATQFVCSCQQSTRRGPKRKKNLTDFSYLHKHILWWNSLSCEGSKYLFILTMYKTSYTRAFLHWQVLITFNKGANYFFSSIYLNTISFDIYVKWASRHEAVMLPTKMTLPEKGIVCKMTMGSTEQAKCE